MTDNYFNRFCNKSYCACVLILIFTIGSLYSSECPYNCNTNDSENSLPLDKLIDAGIAAGYNMEGAHGRYNCNDYHDDLGSILYNDSGNILHSFQKKRIAASKIYSEKEKKLATCLKEYTDFKTKFDDLVEKTFCYSDDENYCARPSVQTRINSLYRYQNSKEPILVCQEMHLLSMFHQQNLSDYTPIQKHKLIEIFGIIWDGEDFQKKPKYQLSPEISSLIEHPFLNEDPVTINKKDKDTSDNKSFNFLISLKDDSLAEYCAKKSYTSLDQYIKLCPQNKLKIIKLATIQLASKLGTIYFTDKQNIIQNIVNSIYSNNKKFSCDTPFYRYYYSITNNSRLAEKLVSLTNNSNIVFNSASSKNFNESNVQNLINAVNHFNSQSLEQIGTVSILIKDNIPPSKAGYYTRLMDTITLASSFQTSTAIHEMTHAWDYKYKLKHKSINDEWVSLSKYVSIIKVLENNINIKPDPLFIPNSDNFVSRYARTDSQEDLATMSAYCAENKYNVPELFKSKCDFFQKYIFKK